MKKKIAFSIPCILSILLIVSCAAQKTQQVPPPNQETCEAPSFRVGDSWKFVAEGGEQWEETIIEKDNKLDIRQNPEVGTLGVLNFPFGGLKIFPLWVGKKYNGIETAECVDGIDLNYFYSYKVLGIVDEKVPAGTFRCYKIELKVSYSSDEGTLHLYYSPQVKGIIKLKSYGGILYKWFGYSLLSYSLK